MRRTTFCMIGLILVCLTGPGATSLFAMDASTAPVDVMVDAQVITDARIVLKQVDSFGPAWVVIYTQAAGGSLGQIVGYTAVCDGMNAYLPVALDMAKVKTASLVAVLHVDRGVVGIFEPQGADTIAHADGEVVATAFGVSY